MKKNGFSVIELMATIGVIAVIGAVGFPAIDNFGDQENYEADLATLRGQINYVRQLSLEEGTAFNIRIVNDDDSNTADLEIWRATGLNRFNVEYHKASTDLASLNNASLNDPKCKRFGSTENKGEILDEFTKTLEHMTIKRCADVDGSCVHEAASENFICFLPDGSAPESLKLEIQASDNAGGKKDYLHTYESGFFNNGKRM